MDPYYYAHERANDLEVKHTYKFTVASKKFKHNFTVTEACERFAKWEAIRRFREKHPNATKVTVTER